MNKEGFVVSFGVEKVGDDGFNGFGMVANGLLVLQGTGFVFSRWVADFGCATAQQDDGLMPTLLKQSQQHDGKQTAHMQTGGGEIKADIGAARLF